MDAMISCIVPVYNAEKYIDICVNSILRQTYSNFELIMIDDGSTDGTSQICDTLAGTDPRIKVLHKKNMGVSSARNDGIRIANGEWITFIDADDWVENEYLEKMLSIADVDDDVVVCSQFLNKKREILETDAKGDIMAFEVSNMINDLMGSAIVRPPSSPRLFLPVFRNGPVFTGPWCKIYRKKTILSNHIQFDPTLKIGEDNVFNLAFLSVSKKGKFIDFPLYHYRIEASSAFHDIKKKIDNWPEYFKRVFPVVMEYKLEKFFYHKVMTEISRMVSAPNESANKESSISQIQAFCENKYCQDALKNSRISDFKGARTKLTIFLLKHRYFKLAYRLYH